MKDFISIIIIILSLISLMKLAFKGLNVIIIAPLIAVATAIVAMFFGSPLDPLYALTDVYMPALGEFIIAYFPVFLLGSVFGKIMGDSGAGKVIAKSIAKLVGEERVILTVVLATAILTYCGVSLFVVVFIINPIAVELFMKTDTPKRFIAPAIALGGFTFTMSALPGSPQFLNSIPTMYFGTGIYAAPTLGIIASLIIFGLGMYYLNKQAKLARKNDEGYGSHRFLKFDIDMSYEGEEEALPSTLASFIPLIFVFFGNLFFFFFFRMEFVINYYERQYPNTRDNYINPTWVIIITMVIAIIVSLILFRKNLKVLNKTIKDGSMGSLMPMLNTSSQNGYGSVIKSLPGFTALQAVLISIPIFPLLKISIATAVLSGIVGSASAGTAMSLSVFGDRFIELMEFYSINPEVMHRVTIIAAGTLDTLPHCGVLISLFSVTSLTHEESYKDIAVTTILIPCIALVAIIAIYGLTGIY